MSLSTQIASDLNRSIYIISLMTNLVNEREGIYIITHSEEEIGHLEALNGTIIEITIHPDHRGHGHATAAIEEYLSQTDHPKITTTTVTSSAFEHILQKLGFTPTDNPHDNAYEYSFEQ